MIDAHPPKLPLSIGDPDLMRTSLGVLPIADLIRQYLWTGWIDAGFLGGAQIERRGNLNSAAIGPYEHRCDSPAAAVRRISPPSPARSCSCPRALPRPRRLRHLARPPAGRRRENGPSAGVTDLGRFDFDGEMRLTAVCPGVTAEEVQARTGWPLRAAPDLQKIPTITPQETGYSKHCKERRGTSPIA